MVVKCEHDYKDGIVLQDRLTNGRSTNPDDWERGEGIYGANKPKLVVAAKCTKCGDTI